MLDERGATSNETSGVVHHPVFGLTALSRLMRLTHGRSDMVIGLIDGPVATGHPGLTGASIHTISGSNSRGCARPDSAACLHGTFVAGILCGTAPTIAPAICPACPLLVRPVFRETGTEFSAMPQDLTAAILDCVREGARLLNVSASMTHATAAEERRLSEALDHAMGRGVIVVAAAGNEGTLGSSVITRHPWVIPVAACDAQGRPLAYSNLGASIGRNGVSAPGMGITSLRASGGTLQISGTSAAAPFVTGTIALLWSLFPMAAAMDVKRAVTQVRRSKAVIPPVLDAWQAYDFMRMSAERRSLR